MRYLSDTGRTVYEFDSLPGCSQVCVSHSMFLKKRYRGQKLSHQEGVERIEGMNLLGYDYALCTVDDSNIAQVKQLISNGWKKLDFFVSSKTDHTVSIYGRLISGFNNRIDYGVEKEFKES